LFLPDRQDKESLEIITLSMTTEGVKLKILICPQCGGKVRYDETANGIICDQCQLLYEIKNDIPVMLVEEAKN
jgi:uncharacterized protein YbaR (Trm112 family)